ncbi:hypothetical protein V5T82_04905 [Magnetovibrio sp. PR-2]|uniref:hypothetical protein n=1 Tax=Magnetovibrio sp. PR-2 TaxID=3120356 RepID=UPI002FCE34A0
MDSLGAQTPVIFAVDAENNIVLTEGDWYTFAHENDGEHLADVLGDSLWDHVSDPGLKLFYKGLIGEIRSKKRSHLSYLYRCDGPQEQRLFRMVVEHNSRGVIRFTSFLEHATEHTEAAYLVSSSTKANLHICAECMKVLVEDMWVEICDALTAYEILKENLFFKFTLSKCPCR